MVSIQAVSREFVARGSGAVIKEVDGRLKNSLAERKFRGSMRGEFTTYDRPIDWQSYNNFGRNPC